MTPAIPFLDLKRQHAQLASELDAALRGVMSSCDFISGRHASIFEQSFAEFCRASHCVGVGNGTDALTVALRALGIGHGHEVLVPAQTFVATAEAVTLTGARPVFVDVCPDTLTMDPLKAESSITPATRALIPVHLYGRPANMTAFRDLADRRGLALVQDCAQAHGASFHDRELASYGDVCCYSFYPGKNLGALGDAGAVVTNSDTLAKRMRMDANHGRTDKYDHAFEGMNSRLDGFQAAVLSVKLRHLPHWTARRRELAARYTSGLSGLDGLALPCGEGLGLHVYHLYVVRSQERDALQAHLSRQGISTGIHYPTAPPFLRAYAHYGHRPEDFPAAWASQNEVLSLPLFPEMTALEQDKVIGAIRDYSAARRSPVG